MKPISGKPKPKPRRICVLRGQQTPVECRMVEGRCISRGHEHVSDHKAAAMVDDGLASWVRNCIRLERAKHWAKRPSFAGGGVFMTMQLVK